MGVGWGGVVVSVAVAWASCSWPDDGEQTRGHADTAVTGQPQGVRGCVWVCGVCVGGPRAQGLGPTQGSGCSSYHAQTPLAPWGGGGATLR